MKHLRPPSGFLPIQLTRGSAWVLPRAKKPLLAAWQQLDFRLPLRQAARRHPKAVLFQGRAPVVSIPCAGLGTIVVRPCVHGGYGGRWMRDLYFGPGRALREIIGSQALHTKGIPTPEILAVLFYPAGLFVRIDVVTSAVPDSQDFVSFLSSRPARSEKKGALTAVRGLLAKLRQHGVVHPDLNARNILLARRSGSPLRAWILDVDAIRWESANSKDVDTANRNRLLRSLFKRARLGDLGMDESSVKFLWRELFPTR